MGSLLKNKALLRLKAGLMHGWPGGYMALTRLAAKTLLYKTERAYLGGKLEPGCDRPSVALLTSIRCASQYVAGVISKIYASEGGTTIDLPRYFFHAQPGRMKDLFREGGYAELFKEKGFFYGAGSASQPGIDPATYRVVCVVRDPRDILVSQFYSLAYAHSPSDQKFVRDRDEAREKGIDWFVQQPERTGMIRGPLSYYADHLADDERVLFWRYEDLMTDFTRFVGELVEQIVPDASDETRQLAEGLAISHRAPDEESAASGAGDKFSHRRSGLSGQFETELKPETVEFLNTEFDGLLRQLGYVA